MAAEARPGDDVATIAWVIESAFDAYGLSPEARRIIAAAKTLAKSLG
ncbi:MAG: hypothetical protein PHZ23_03635 [Acidiphilium sp.]|nr:hypothetical protein [Acidiphilium sp.]